MIIKNPIIISVTPKVNLFFKNGKFYCAHGINFVQSGLLIMDRYRRIGFCETTHPRRGRYPERGERIRFAIRIQLRANKIAVLQLLITHRDFAYLNVFIIVIRCGFYEHINVSIILRTLRLSYCMDMKDQLTNCTCAFVERWNNWPLITIRCISKVQNATYNFCEQSK